MSTEADEAIIAAVPGLTKDQLRFARDEWQKPGNWMRRVIAHLAQMTIAQQHEALETCTEEEMARHQGVIAGVRELAATIAAQGKP